MKEIFSPTLDIRQCDWDKYSALNLDGERILEGKADKG